MSDEKPAYQAQRVFSRQKVRSCQKRAEKQSVLEPQITHLDHDPLTQHSQTLFNNEAQFVAVMDNDQNDNDSEQALQTIIQPGKKRRGLGLLITTFSGLVAWQAVDSVLLAWQQADWLALGWAGFISALSALGLAAIGKEALQLRRLSKQIDRQTLAGDLYQSCGHGKAQDFCQHLAKSSGINSEFAAYDRWQHSVTEQHNDSEVMALYDAMVVAEQDKQAQKLVASHATEAALLVAVSPLALADMLLVAWRNFKLLDQLAKVYGVQLGYWSRLRLLKLVLVNIAVAGASELAIDASMDLLSMDIAAKLSSRAAQGIGVGILTARLGLKAISLLRPVPWSQQQPMRLGQIRKAIIERVTLQLKPVKK